MSTEYLSDVENFVTHEDVSARESMAGTSFLMGVLVIALVGGAVVWWRRRVR